MRSPHPGARIPEFGRPRSSLFHAARPLPRPARQEQHGSHDAASNADHMGVLLQRRSSDQRGRICAAQALAAAAAYQAGGRPVPSDEEAAMLQVRVAVGLSLAVLLAAPSRAMGQAETASVIGQLVNRATRAPIEGATVVLLSTGAVATSDSAGRFRYAGLVPGEHRLEVRAIGYVKNEWTVHLRAGDQQREFELDALTYQLPGVVVEARGALGDFERRRAHGTGFFFTRPEVEGRHARTLGDLM